MISSIRQVPLTPERLKDESPRAYRAFSVYRDLGATRSLDKAWRQFVTQQGKDAGLARRPGQWTEWSKKFRWVERAEAHDDLIDQERRKASAEKRRRLEDMNLDFAVESLQRKQDRIRKMDDFLDAELKASRAEITQVKYDIVARTTTTTKRKPSTLKDIGAYSESLNKVDDSSSKIEDPAAEERRVERVVWAEPKAA